MTDNQPDKGRYDWEDGDVIVEPGKQSRPLMRAVAEVVVNEEKARAAADRELAADLAQLHERIDGIDKTTVPADLAVQLKSAAETLAEPPPRELEMVKVDPAADFVFAPVRSVTGAVVTRSGELAISYSDGSGERLGHVIGPQGEKGAQGDRGEPGHDGIGIKGEDGPPGRDGVSVTAASINRDGELTLTLSDGSVLTPGRVVAPDKKRA